jgi:hypothetical protein
MTARPSAWLPGALLALALTHATGCWSVPADPGENARLRARRDVPALAAAGGSGGGSPGLVADGADPAAASLYAVRCAQCHEAYPPEAFSAGEWPLYVDRYGPRAGLYGADRASVLRWLQANAGR